jgi:hypothetical protein
MCESCKSEKEQGDLVTRRSAMKKCLLFAGGVLLSAVSIFTAPKKAEAAACRACNSCYGFTGSSYLCSTCGHHWNFH